MKQRFPSKIDWFFPIGINIILLVVCAILIYGEAGWACFAILPLQLFILHLFLTTRYDIDANNLYIKCGLLYNASIPITKIKSIKKTNSILSSPAASMDRIEIRYNKFDFVLISPADKNGFIKALLEIKPEIEVAL